MVSSFSNYIDNGSNLSWDVPIKIGLPSGTKGDALVLRSVGAVSKVLLLNQVASILNFPLGG